MTTWFDKTQVEEYRVEPDGTMMVVHNPTVTPAELLQFTTELAPNPYYRLEPIDAVARIAEDRMDQIPIVDEGVITPFDPRPISVTMS